MLKFLLLLSIHSLNARADLPVHFPGWLTDATAKMWAVDRLVAFMKDDNFYKIQSIGVKRYFDEKNKCDALEVSLKFDDPGCKDREVQVQALAPLCGDQGCQTFDGLTDCIGQKIEPARGLHSR